MSQLNNDSLTNYVSFQDLQSDQPRIGHYDLTNKTIQPLSFISGTPISTLYQIIEASTTQTLPSGPPFPASTVKILPPLTGRDILCVGKNYAEHAREFNSSGFDSSDKADQPSHPVIFTKRYTSVIADGEDILPHAGFTQTADYEGEIGVIVGRAGFRIAEEEAMGYVWGYTIVNDVTARERQRDHKQFYIGKSADTFCPMGPIAVPASKLEKVLRVQTRVNGELRQDATTDDLIFSIPYLIKTMSEGQTLMPGDVLATGTPAGVGIGRKPPVYLRPGDSITVSVTGLGTLTNRIASLDAPNPTLERYQKTTSPFSFTYAGNCPSLKGLTIINNKPLYYKSSGNRDGPPIVFVHGLGATNEYFTPLIASLSLFRNYCLHLFDFEGHGLSPTHSLSTITLATLASDLNALFTHASISPDATIIADSLGCLIASQFALSYPNKFSKLILISPPPLPLPEDTIKSLNRGVEMARIGGMDEAVGNSDEIAALLPVTLAARRMALLAQDPEGYAKACRAFADASLEPVYGGTGLKTVIIKHKDDLEIMKIGQQRENVGSGYLRVLGGTVRWDIRTSAEMWVVFDDLKNVARCVERSLDGEDDDLEGEDEESK